MVRDVFDNMVAADRFRLKVPSDLRLVLHKEKCYRSEKIFHNRKIFSVLEKYISRLRNISLDIKIIDYFLS